MDLGTIVLYQDRRSIVKAYWHFEKKLNVSENS